MAVQKRIDGKLTTLTDKDIKAEVQKITGWTTKEYQKEYDKFRNRVRNYERTIGAKKGSIRANEEFYRIKRKERDGYALTSRQQALKEFSSATPTISAERAAKLKAKGKKATSFEITLEAGGSGARKAQTIAKAALLGVENLEQHGLNSANIKNLSEEYDVGAFSGLLGKSGVARREFEEFLRQNPDATADEINYFLDKQSKDLKTRIAAYAEEGERNKGDWY